MGNLRLQKNLLGFDAVSIPDLSVTELKLFRFSSESISVFTYCITLSVLACMICAAEN